MTTLVQIFLRSLVCISALAVGEVTADSFSLPGQQVCYGNSIFGNVGTGWQQAVNITRGRSRIPLHDRNFFCDPQQCSGTRKVCTRPDSNLGGTCFLLGGSSMLHIFINGTLSQSPIEVCPAQDLVASNANPERVLVLCRSVAPDFRPTYEVLELTSTGKWAKHDRPRTLSSVTTDTFSHTPTNAVIIGGEYEGERHDVIVSTIANSTHLFVHLDSTHSQPHTISLASQCDTITGLTGGLPFISSEETQHTQFIASCIQSNTHTQWIVTLNDFLEIESTPARLGSGTGRVMVSPKYFLITNGNRITLIDRIYPNHLPATKRYVGNITNAQFLSPKGVYVLVEINGSNRRIIMAGQFINSGAQDGDIELPNSLAECRQNICPAYTFIDSRYLVVFTPDVMNREYYESVAYDVRSPMENPQLIGRILSTDFPTVCYYNGNVTILVTTSTTRDFTPTPPDETSSPTQEEITTSNGSDPTPPPHGKLPLISLLLLLVIPISVALIYLTWRLFKRFRSLPGTTAAGNPPIQCTHPSSSCSTLTSGYSSNANSGSTESIPVTVRPQTVQDGSSIAQFVAGTSSIL